MNKTKKILVISACLIFLASGAIKSEAAPKKDNPGQQKKAENVKQLPTPQVAQPAQQKVEKAIEKAEQKIEKVQQKEEQKQLKQELKVEAKGPEVKTQAEIEAEIKEDEEVAVFVQSIQKELPGANAIPWRKIKIKGKNNIKFDVPPVIKANRTLVPVRAIMNGLKADVEWIQETQTVIITKDDKVIELVLGSAEVKVNGEIVVIDVPAFAVSNRTFVPLRFISEIFGEKVDYDAETGEIIIGEEDEEIEAVEDAEDAEEAEDVEEVENAEEVEVDLEQDQDTEDPNSEDQATDTEDGQQQPDQDSDEDSHIKEEDEDSDQSDQDSEDEDSEATNEEEQEDTEEVEQP